MVMTKGKSIFGIGIELSRSEMKQLMAARDSDPGEGEDCLVGGCLVEYMCCCADGSKHCTSNCFQACCSSNPNCA